MKLAYCPACGATEKPVLVMTSHYTCPDCETVTPREKLDFKRRNHYVLAGTGEQGLVVTHVGTTIATDSGAGAVITFNMNGIVFGQPGELLLAFFGGNGIVGPSSTSLVDGADAMTLITERLIAATYSAVFAYDSASGFTIPGATHTIVAQAGKTGGTTANMAVHLVKVSRFDPANPMNTGSENFGSATSTSPSVTSAAAVPGGSYDLAVCASNQNTGAAGIAWTAPFVEKAATGSNVGSNDFLMSVASKTNLSNSTFTAAGSLSASTQWSECVVAVRPR